MSSRKSLTLIHDFRATLINPDGGGADAKDAPEPDAAHRPFQENVEAGIDKKRDPERAQEKEDALPAGIVDAPALPISAADAKDPCDLKRRPERQPRRAHSRQHGHVPVVRAAQRVIRLHLITIFV